MKKFEPKEKSLIWRPTRRWVDNIRLDLREMEWEGL